MSDELQSRLQQQLGTAYALERELEGGGMSRVFVARDTALARTVAISVMRDVARGRDTPAPSLARSTIRR